LTLGLQDQLEAGVRPITLAFARVDTDDAANPGLRAESGYIQLHNKKVAVGDRFAGREADAEHREFDDVELEGLLLNF
jgi:hypothetical protein